MKKIKFTDFGRCLICLHNPCDCKKNCMKTDQQRVKIEEVSRASESHDSGRWYRQYRQTAY